MNLVYAVLSQLSAGAQVRGSAWLDEAELGHYDRKFALGVFWVFNMPTAIHSQVSMMLVLEHHYDLLTEAAQQQQT